MCFQSSFSRKKKILWTLQFARNTQIWIKCEPQEGHLAVNLIAVFERRAVCAFCLFRCEQHCKKSSVVRSVLLFRRHRVGMVPREQLKARPGCSFGVRVPIAQQNNVRKSDNVMMTMGEGRKSSPLFDFGGVGEQQRNRGTIPPSFEPPPPLPSTPPFNPSPFSLSLSTFTFSPHLKVFRGFFGGSPGGPRGSLRGCLRGSPGWGVSRGSPGGLRGFKPRENLPFFETPRLLPPLNFPPRQRTSF